MLNFTDCDWCDKYIYQDEVILEILNPSTSPNIDESVVIDTITYEVVDIIHHIENRECHIILLKNINFLGKKNNV